MKSATESCVLVTNEPVTKEGSDEVIAPAQWRVAMRCDDGIKRSLNSNSNDFFFASERDAQIGKAALERAGILTASDAIKAGRKRLIEIMCEALPW